MNRRLYLRLYLAFLGITVLSLIVAAFRFTVLLPAPAFRSVYEMVAAVKEGRAAVLVMAQVNDSEPFKVSLFPNGGGKHYIRIKAKVRKETETKTGDRVRVQFTVLDRADVTIPRDLMSALRAENVTEDFKSLPPGKQNFIIRRIDDAAKPETRDKRIQETVEAVRRKREK